MSGGEGLVSPRRNSFRQPPICIEGLDRIQNWSVVPSAIQPALRLLDQPRVLRTLASRSRGLRPGRKTLRC